MELEQRTGRTREQQQWLEAYFFSFGVVLREDDSLYAPELKQIIARIKKVKFNAKGIAQIEIVSHSRILECAVPDIKSPGPRPT